MIRNLFLIILLFIRLSSSAYNKSQSIQYAYLSAATHCSKASIEGWTCKHCSYINNFINVTQIQNLQTQIVGFVGYHLSSNRIIVAWRGTIDARNWAQDFNFEMLPYACKGCQVHSGFYLSYKSVEGKVRSKVQSLIKAYPTAKILVTGHSLGGALATICALELQLQYGIVESIHNFGSPRTGNQNLARFINSKISNVFRVVHNKDIVPHLPPQQAIPYQYRHIYYQVFYDESMTNYKICDQTGEDKTCSNQYFPNYSFSDHDVYWAQMDC